MIGGGDKPVAQPFGVRHSRDIFSQHAGTGARVVDVVARAQIAVDGDQSGGGRLGRRDDLRRRFKENRGPAAVEGRDSVVALRRCERGEQEDDRTDECG